MSRNQKFSGQTEGLTTGIRARRFWGKAVCRKERSRYERRGRKKLEKNELTGMVLQGKG